MPHNENHDILTYIHKILFVCTLLVLKFHLIKITFIERETLGNLIIQYLSINSF